jgi:hypothetical protein
MGTSQLPSSQPNSASSTGDEADMAELWDVLTRTPFVLRHITAYYDPLLSLPTIKKLEIM